MKIKSKKEQQIATKQRRKKGLRKTRRSQPDFGRPAPHLEEKPIILIVCEGRNTEPSYFKQFKLTSATVKAIGEGYNTTSLVDRAHQLLENQYDQVWCVFDKDDFDDNDFNNAIQTANGHEFGVAYSNQAFEYWLILHFIDHQGGGMDRKDYNQKLNKLLRPYVVTYDGGNSKRINEDFFEILDGFDDKTDEKRLDLAIKRAERNYNQHNHYNRAKEESTTTVFKLVTELLKYI